MDMKILLCALGILVSSQAVCDSKPVAPILPSQVVKACDGYVLGSVKTGDCPDDGPKNHVMYKCSTDGWVLISDVDVSCQPKKKSGKPDPKSLPSK